MNLAWFLPFLIASILFFTAPGVLLLNKSRLTLSFWQKIFLGTVIGYIIFTLVSYLFLILGIGFLIFPFFIAIDIYFFRSFKKDSLKDIFRQKNLFITISIFIIGILGQLLVIAPSGWNVNGDLLFWSSHAHDASWHMALTNEIQRIKLGSVIQNPEYAGVKLTNYHIFSDIAPAMFNKYLQIPELELYFRFFPFLYSLLLGSSAFFLGKAIGKSYLSGIWSAIFIYFGGSFGYIVTLIHHGGIGGESIFWGSQIQSSIGNPPFIAANVILITFLYFLLRLLGKNNKIIFFVSALLLGSLAVFKIYAAIVLFFALGIAGVWEIVRERRFRIISLTIPSGLLALALFLPFYSQTSSFLIFQPWWYIRSMIASDGRLNWVDLELRRQFYLSLHSLRGYLRVTEYELIGFSIFFFGNLGMRFIGLYGVILSAKTFFKNYFNQVLILMTFLSLIFPLLFLQKGVAGGTANFLEYFILGFGFFAAITVAKLMAGIKNKILTITLSAVIIVLAVPTQIGLLRELYSRNPYTKITKGELSALNFLKNNTSQDSIVLTPPYDPNLNLGGPIPNVWDWFDTAYVTAFSARRTYFDDYEQVDIMGYDYRNRLKVKQAIFDGTDAVLVKQTIGETGAQIIYFPKPMHPKVDLSRAGLTKIFENSEVEIWSKSL